MKEFRSSYIRGFLMHSNRSIAIRHTVSKDVKAAIHAISPNTKLNLLVIFPAATAAMFLQNPFAPTKESEIARLVT